MGRRFVSGGRPVALVTGASRGIGLACARAFAADGYAVVVTSRDQGAAEEAARVVGSGAVGLAAHAADADAARACIAIALERFGRLDVLVNNAGTNPAYGEMIAQDHERFAKTVDVNLWGPLTWTAAACEAWFARHGGAVVNTASLGGLEPAATLGVYNVTKAALIHTTRQLALELAPKVRVNAVAPGVVRTRLAEALWTEHEDRVAAATPLRRIGEPEDVAAAVLFLASKEASWITGETLVIDGGQRLLGAPVA